MGYHINTTEKKQSTTLTVSHVTDHSLIRGLIWN